MSEDCEMRETFEKEVVPRLWGTFIDNEILATEMFDELLERKANGFYKNIAVACAFFGWRASIDLYKKAIPESLEVKQ